VCACVVLLGPIQTKPKACTTRPALPGGQSWQAVLNSRTCDLCSTCAPPLGCIACSSSYPHPTTAGTQDDSKSPGMGDCCTPHRPHCDAVQAAISNPPRPPHLHAAPQLAGTTTLPGLPCSRAGGAAGAAPAGLPEVEHARRSSVPLQAVFYVDQGVPPFQGRPLPP